MFTSGLVITCSAEPALGERAWEELCRCGPFLLGAETGPVRSAVLEADDQAAALAWHQWAAERPGVVDVEVVFVHWDEETEASHAAF